MKKLAQLYKHGNYAEMLPVLEQLSRQDAGKLELFRNSRFFQDMPDEIALRSPQVCVMLALIFVIHGNLSRADHYVRLLQEKQYACRRIPSIYAEIEYCLTFLDTALPHRSQNCLFSSLKRLAQLSMQQGENAYQLSFAANRPSIINGGRDFSRYLRYIPQLRRTFVSFTQSYYGDRGVGIVDIAIAEILYQQDRIYDALVLTVSALPFIEQKGDMNTLFAAMAVQAQIMVLSGQVSSAKAMAENMRSKVLASGAEYLLLNLNAMVAWGAMYDGDYETISHWLREESPNEYGEFFTFDRMRYFIKLRAYLIYGKHLAAVALAERLKPILLAFGRHMELCELSVLLALSHAAQGETDISDSYLEHALQFSEKYSCYRLLANEGQRLYSLLRHYLQRTGETPHRVRILEMTRKLALLYPNYLKPRKENFPLLTIAETEVLRLMAADYSNTEIGDFFNISLNTVKFHSKNIFSKLDVRSRRQAVRIAKENNLI